MKNSLFYGSLTAITLISWKAVVLNMSVDDNESSGVMYMELLSLGILAGGLLLGMRAMKRRNHKSLPFKYAFFTGMNISIAAGILSAILLLIYFKDISPETFKQMKSLYEVDTEETESAFLISQMISQFTRTSLGGLLLSLPIGYLMKTPS